jgi:K+-transporting ATPase ATPase C chain
MLVLLTLVLGVLYTLAVTGVGQLLFPHQANGSLIVREGQVVGSELIGQSFDDPRYFWGRPSATQPFPYNAAASAGSNLGPRSPDLLTRFWKQVAALRLVDPDQEQPIPVDLVTASGSGLDPDISLAAALYQVPRVAQARGLSEEQVRDLVWANACGRQLGFLGEPRVNVLQLNLALDAVQ